MKKQLATLLAVTALGIGVLSGCGVSAASNSTGSSSDSAGAIEITNVSYDPTRELYAAYNDLFAKHWKEEKGQDVSVVQSHGALEGENRRGCGDHTVSRWFRKAGA